MDYSSNNGYATGLFETSLHFENFQTSPHPDFQPLGLYSVASVYGYKQQKAWFFSGLESNAPKWSELDLTSPSTDNSKKFFVTKSLMSPFSRIVFLGSFGQDDSTVSTPSITREGAMAAFYQSEGPSSKPKKSLVIRTKA